MAVYDHIIVGAGINGSSAAYQLARRGAEVLLLEKDGGLVKRNDIIELKLRLIDYNRF